MSCVQDRLRAAVLRSRTPPTDFIEPCLPPAAPSPPTGADWLHEIKFDGYRLFARRDGAGIRLLTRNGYDWTDRYPLIRQAANELPCRSYLIDGEVVCCDESGIPVFQKLRYRRGDSAAFLYAFDLLKLDGKDLRREPLELRKAKLAKLLRSAGPGLRLSEHMEGDGPTIFLHACKLGFEGIVSKRASSRCAAWRCSTRCPTIRRGGKWSSSCR